MNQPFLAIFWGGIACGVLDISSAFLGYGLRGVPPIRILQSVAAGLLGRDAFNGGWTSALIGLVCHFTVAFGATIVFYLASRKIPFMIDHPFVTAFFYGEAVYLFMRFVVIPLSRTHAGPFTFTFANLIAGPLGHPFFVGLPIALAIRHFAGHISIADNLHRSAA